MKTTNLILAIILASTLAGCGKPEKVSNDTLESYRIKAKENAKWNAAKFTANPLYADYATEVSTDSSMTVTCPQGDGWVSVNLININNPNEVIELKCSTYSIGLGCMTTKTFKQKDYKNDDGICQPTDKVPSPLPTLKN